MNRTPTLTEWPSGWRWRTPEGPSVRALRMYDGPCDCPGDYHRPGCEAERCPHGRPAPCPYGCKLERSTP